MKKKPKTHKSQLKANADYYNRLKSSGYKRISIKIKAIWEVDIKKAIAECVKQLENYRG